MPSFACAIAALLSLGSDAERAQLDFASTVGPEPRLGSVHRTLIPTTHVAPAKGWNGAMPVAAPGTAVTAFASGLKHPRWIYVLPNGDVLVAESNGPERPVEFKGVTAWFMKQVMQCVGDGVESADRITLIRPRSDGTAAPPTTFLEGLKSPFGMALVGNDLYVANTDAVMRFPYREGATRIDPRSGVRLATLPAGERNHHWTKNIIASRDGKKLYASVGSNSDHQDYGEAEEEGRARIWEIDLASGKMDPFATGLRNPNGMGWEPSTGALWTVVNERDALGSDLVPDYLTSVTRGASYGWPYCYYGTHADTRLKPPRPDLKCDAKRPDYALGNHVAPLGLAFSEGASLPREFAGGAFIGQHGSWNRRPFSGYSVVFVAFADGKPKANTRPVEVLGGFIDAKGRARGRPVGVAIDKSGALLVADDVGNMVWRVVAAPRP
jgi:glucose/arabinose dehydrogenase